MCHAVQAALPPYCCHLHFLRSQASAAFSTQPSPSSLAAFAAAAPAFAAFAALAAASPAARWAGPAIHNRRGRSAHSQDWADGEEGGSWATQTAKCTSVSRRAAASSGG